MFIEFTFDPKFLYIFFFPIFRELEKIFSTLFLKNSNNLFNIFKIFLSYELSFILLLIFKYKNKSTNKEIIHDENDKNDDNDSNKLVDIEIKSVDKKNKIKSILFLFLLSALYLGSYIFNYYTRNDYIRISRMSIGLIYEIIIFYILSLLILKEKYYKHHYFSLLPICITLIVLSIMYVKKLENPNYNIYNVFWYYLVYYALYCSFDIFLKKFFKKYFYSIYSVILIIGAFACVPLLIYDIITFFVKKDISGIIICLIDNVNTVKNVFLFIVDLLIVFITNLGIFWTIYYFTPFHLIICEFFSELLGYYIQLIQFKIEVKTIFPSFCYETNNIIIFSVFFLINLLFSLIFNEIIILKFCKLEYYTKKYIKVRAELDASSLFTNFDPEAAENELVNIHDN